MNWFKNLNAVPKIMTACGGLLLFVVGVSFLALSQISEFNDIAMQIFTREVGGMKAIEQAEVDEATMSSTMALAALAQGNAASVGVAEQDFASSLTDLRRSLDSAYSLSIRTQLREQLKSAQSALPAVESGAQNLFARARSLDRASTAIALKGALGGSNQLRELLHRAGEIKEANVGIFKANQGIAMGRTRARFLWFIVSATFFGSFVSLTIARSFSQPLNDAVSALRKVAQGNLTERLNIDSTNEIGQLAQALDAALTNISELITEVRQSSQSLTSAASQLARSSDILASGAHEQAASLEQTSASLEQITATVKQNSDNASQASQFALSSRDAAEKGGVVVNSAVGAMTQINEASTKIAAIIRVIDEIAFQTNLLAVNASVEAARAREHGKGFAVVATEVRTLAQRSSSAAKEIKGLIGDSVRKVENGSHLVSRSGQTLTDIVTSVKRVTDIVSEIASASREQSAGIEQVNTAMLQMDSVMQSNSSQTEELSATANLLASNALHLEKLISRFVVKAENPTQPKASVVSTSVPPVPIHQASTSADDLRGLAANLGQPASMAALDEEFEEF